MSTTKDEDPEHDHDDAPERVDDPDEGCQVDRRSEGEDDRSQYEVRAERSQPSDRPGPERMNRAGRDERVHGTRGDRQREAKEDPESQIVHREHRDHCLGGRRPRYQSKDLSAAYPWTLTR